MRYQGHFLPTEITYNQHVQAQHRQMHFKLCRFFHLHGRVAFVEAVSKSFRGL